MCKLNYMYLQQTTSLRRRHYLRRCSHQVTTEIWPTFSSEFSQRLAIRIGLLELRGSEDMVQSLEIRRNDNGRLET